jgi:hypothetical protein
VTFSEKKLYHQIHPLKLLVDISTGLFTTYLLWIRNAEWFLLLFLLPSLLISFVLIRFVDLEKQKRSRLGAYVLVYMNLRVEAARFCGQILMWIAAWFHSFIFICVGFLIVVGAWCSGLLFKKQ